MGLFKPLRDDDRRRADEVAGREQVVDRDDRTPRVAADRSQRDEQQDADD